MSTTGTSAGAPIRYAGPPTPEELAARLGISLERLCKLDANESPYGPPPAALAALASLGQPSPLGAGRYPDPSASRLRAALAGYTGVEPERLVAGNGSDELIHLLVELFIDPAAAGEVVVAEPTFSLYALAARRRGATVVDAGCERDFAVTPERVTAAMTPQTRLVFLCSPNNPTGTALPRETLLAALERAEALGRERDAAGGPLIIVDEAYYEIGMLAGIQGTWTAMPLLHDHPRLVVLRTFSKVFGLAGLRVGYAACSPELAERLRVLKQPYNVSVAGQVAARTALGEMDWLRERTVAMVRERERVARELARCAQLAVYPSAANFLFVQIGAPASGAAMRMWAALLDRGILVRRFTDQRLASYLRITIGTPEENDRLLMALSEILADDLALASTGGDR